MRCNRSTTDTALAGRVPAISSTSNFRRQIKAVPFVSHMLPLADSHKSRLTLLNACSFGRVTYASSSDASMVRDTLAVDPEVMIVEFKHRATGSLALAAHSWIFVTAAAA